MLNEIAHVHPRLTLHARTRMQQRGIPRKAVDLLLTYGRVQYDHQGGKLVYLDNAARRRIAAMEGEALVRQFGSSLNTYAVLSTDDAVITVGHRTQRVRH